MTNQQYKINELDQLIFVDMKKIRELNKQLEDLKKAISYRKGIVKVNKKIRQDIIDNNET